METRILVYATNIKTKFYGHWCHRVLNLPTLQKGDCYQTNNPIQDTVSVSVYYDVSIRMGVSVCMCMHERTCVCMYVCDPCYYHIGRI